VGAEAPISEASAGLFHSSAAVATLVAGTGGRFRVEAERQIRVLGTLTAVTHGLVGVGFFLFGVVPWLLRFPSLPSAEPLAAASYLAFGVLLGVLMRSVPGRVGWIASGILGVLLAGTSLPFWWLGETRILVVLARAVGAYAIGLGVAAAFERPETFERRTGFERHLERPWFTALSVFALSLLPGPSDLVERVQGRAHRRERDARDRAVQQAGRFAASARECERTHDFWTFCGAIRALAISPDGRLAATADQRYTVTQEQWSTRVGTGAATLSLWSLEGKSRRLWRKEVPHLTQDSTLQLLFSPDARWLALVTSGSVVTYRTADGTERLSVKDCSGSSGSWHSVGAGFSPDGRALAVAAQGICLFDPDTGSRSRSFSPSMCGNNFALIARGRVWTRCLHGPEAFDLDTGARVAKLAFPPHGERRGQPRAHGLVSMHVTGDGTRLVTIGEDDSRQSIASVWDAQSGALVSSFALGMKVHRRAGIAVFGAPARVAVSDSRQKKAVIYDLSTGKLVDSLDAPHAIGGLGGPSDGSAVVLGFHDAPHFHPDRADHVPWGTVKRWKLWR
jgi:hypothetical protein